MHSARQRHCSSCSTSNTRSSPATCIGRFRVLASSDETEDSIAPAEVVKILDEEPKRRNPVVIKPL